MCDFLQIISNRGLVTAGMRQENWQNIQLQKWIAIFVTTDMSHADTSVQFYVKVTAWNTVKMSDVLTNKFRSVQCDNEFGVKTYFKFIEVKHSIKIDIYIYIYI
jgi:hypothetical protein